MVSNQIGGTASALNFVQTVIANKQASVAQHAAEAESERRIANIQTGKHTRAVVKHVLGPVLWDELGEKLRIHDEGKRAELAAAAAAEFGLAHMVFIPSGDEVDVIIHTASGTRTLHANNSFLGELLVFAREAYLEIQRAALNTKRSVNEPESAARAYAELKKWDKPENAAAADALFAEWRTANELKQQELAKRADAAQVLAAYQSAYAAWYQDAVVLYEQNKARIAEWLAARADQPLRYWILKYAVVAPYDDGIEIEAQTVVVANEAPDSNGYWTVLGGAKWVQCRYNHWVSVEAVDTTWGEADIVRWSFAVDARYTRGLGHLTVDVPVQPGMSKAEMGEHIRTALQLAEIPETPERPQSDILYASDFSRVEHDVERSVSREEEELPF